MTKSAAWRAVIAAGTITLALATVTPSISAWAEEVPLTATSEEPAASPEESADPVPDATSETPATSEPPSAEAPAVDPTTVPETSDTPTEQIPTDAGAVSETDGSVSAPRQSQPTTAGEEAVQSGSGSSNSGHTGRRTSAPVLDVAEPTVLEIATTPDVPLQLQPQTEVAATPTPTATSTPSTAPDPMDSATSAAASSFSPLAVIGLVGSLCLLAVLGLGNVVYRTRIANHQKARAFFRH